MGNFDILGPVHKDPILVRQIAKMRGKLHFWPFLAILAHIIDCISISQCQTDIHLDLSEWHGWWQGQMRPSHLNLALDRPKKCQKHHFRCQICPKIPIFYLFYALNGPNMAAYGLSGIYGLILDGKSAILSVLGSNGG